MSERRGTGAIDRRLAIGGGLAAAAGLSLPRSQARSRVITQRGVAGGGQVGFAEGEAQFALGASSVTTAEDGVEGEPAFLGSLRWVDGSVGLTLESVRITNYENLDLATGEGRRVEGVVTTGESGEQPFLLEVFFDFPNAEPDRITLEVGIAAEGGAATPGADPGFTYAADGEIVVGDLVGGDFAIDLETGDVTAPEPA